MTEQCLFEVSVHCFPPTLNFTSHHRFVALFRWGLTWSTAFVKGKTCCTKNPTNSLANVFNMEAWETVFAVDKIFTEARAFTKAFVDLLHLSCLVYLKTLQFKHSNPISLFCQSPWLALGVVNLKTWKDLSSLVSSRLVQVADGIDYPDMTQRWVQQIPARKSVRQKCQGTAIMRGR